MAKGSDSVEGAAKAVATESIVGAIIKERYLVKQQIGSGGFGSVYLAHDLELLSKPVVVKLLNDKSLQNEWVLTKFRHETEALARIDHPGVVGVLATGSLPDGNPFMVMEYVEGVSLRSLMEEDPKGMEFERATNIIHQIGYALNAAHDKGIVHRDLKPENVMIRQLSGEEEQVKLIDFGIAKVKDSRLAPSTIVGETAGTVVYMAPEQLNGQSVSPATDIYSLGAMAYEMLTYRRPFNPETIFQLSEIQRRGVNVKPSDLRRFLPLSVDDVILKALSYDSETRFATAGKFADAFAEAMLEGTVSESQRVKQAIAETVHLPNLVVPVPQKRKPWWLIAPAIVMLAIVVAGGVFLWRRASSKTVSDQPIVQSQPVVTPVNASDAITRSIDYYLMVTKVLAGKPDGKPFRATGKLTLLNGFLFSLHTSGTQGGFLYLINEGPSADGTTSYNLLYPTPKYHDGSAWVENGKTETGPYALDNNPGKEKFWLIWSGTKVEEFEAVKGVVNPKDKGIISDPQRTDAIRKFLSDQWLQKPDVTVDETNYNVRVTKKSNVLVNLIELEHR